MKNKIRKFKHKPIFTLTKGEIERIKEEYWVKYNK